MSGEKTSTTRLVGDIGGTNTRLAAFDVQACKLRSINTYTNADYPDLSAVIAAGVGAHPGEAPDSGCLAIAAPPFDDRVTMLNIGWSFSVAELAARFAIANLRCINDFQGNAYALPHLNDGDVAVLRSAPAGHPGNTPPPGKLAVVGPGTGLGGATLEYCGDTPVASASEPGHIGLSPGNDLELAVFGALLRDYEEVYGELLLSGPGLSLLCKTLAAVRGERPPGLNAAEITAAALSGESALCTQTLQIFCNLLGSVCGDYVLATGAYGGLYLAGGIVPRIVPLIQRSDFIHRFSHKGAMAAHLQAVPLYVITGTTTGLLGAANAPL